MRQERSRAVSVCESSNSCNRARDSLILSILHCSTSLQRIEDQWDNQGERNQCECQGYLQVGENEKQAYRWDLPLLRWRPRGGPTDSTMSSAATRPTKVPSSRYHTLRLMEDTSAWIRLKVVTSSTENFDRCTC